MTNTIRHGGDLQRAMKEYGGRAQYWVDLSTGINPDGYPVPQLPASAWQRLPEEEDGLAAFAAHYYDAQHALPVAGSQAAIRALPTLLKPGRVGIAALGYSEYAPAFARAGHEVVLLDEADFLRADLGASLDHLVVVNPNNPTARQLPPETLLQWHADLAKRGGTLLVDEAFMDCTPDQTIAPHSHLKGLVVLRSIGKFFGLAGVRCGFVLAAPALLEALSEILGHWTVSGPARAVARIVLDDVSWESITRAQLIHRSEKLRQFLVENGFEPVRHSLFCWVPHPNAEWIQTVLAADQVWTRYFPAAGGSPPGLRFGLPPGSPRAWAQISKAFDTLSQVMNPDGY